VTPQTILKRPIITERATALGERHNKVAFEVAVSANKGQIRDAVEYLYSGVKVTSVRTMILPGKVKRRGMNLTKSSSWKKAIVTLRKGDVIDFFAAE
jgi:large subunit ribosomal protein L23